MKEINCPYITNSIHFYCDHVRACSNNAQGPILIEDYKGEKINWIELINKRLELRQQFLNGNLHENCTNCYEIESFRQNNNELNVLIDRMYISHWLHCNCGCIYCVHKDETNGEYNKKVKRSKNYNLLPVLQDMIKENALSKEATIYITGGEPTVLNEFDKILELLTSYINRPIHVFTSGIRFNKAIYNALKQGKCTVLTSIDAGSKETYQKIKRVHCFNDVKETIKKYASASPTAGENITLKYILLKDLNDNIPEIEKWLFLAKELNVKNVQLDVEYSNSCLNEQKNIPEHYYEMYNYLEKRTDELGLNLFVSNQIKAFLKKGYVF